MDSMIKVSVLFHSYFKDVMGCAEFAIEVPNGSNVSELSTRLAIPFPQWITVHKCALVAVGVEYQTPDYVLKPGDEVSFFPPVQGG